MAIDVRLAMKWARTLHAQGKSAEEAHKIIKQMWLDQIAADQKCSKNVSQTSIDDEAQDYVDVERRSST